MRRSNHEYVWKKKRSIETKVAKMSINVYVTQTVYPNESLNHQRFKKN